MEAFSKRVTIHHGANENGGNAQLQMLLAENGGSGQRKEGPSRLRVEHASAIRFLLGSNSDELSALSDCGT